MTTKSDSQKAMYPSSLSQLNGMQAAVFDTPKIVPMHEATVMDGAWCSRSHCRKTVYTPNALWTNSFFVSSFVPGMAR